MCYVNVSQYTNIPFIILILITLFTDRPSRGQQRSAPIDGSRERRSHLAQRRVEKMRKHYSTEVN